MFNKPTSVCFNRNFEILRTPMVSGAEAGLLCVISNQESGTKVARDKAAAKFELCSTNDPAVVTFFFFFFKGANCGYFNGIRHYCFLFSHN
jgi:hypothetical protein